MVCSQDTRNRPRARGMRLVRDPPLRVLSSQPPCSTRATGALTRAFPPRHGAAATRSPAKPLADKLRRHHRTSPASPSPPRIEPGTWIASASPDSERVWQDRAERRGVSFPSSPPPDTRSPSLPGPFTDRPTQFSPRGDFYARITEHPVIARSAPGKCVLVTLLTIYYTDPFLPAFPHLPEATTRLTVGTNSQAPITATTA